MVFVFFFLISLCMTDFSLWMGLLPWFHLQAHLLISHPALKMQLKLPLLQNIPDWLSDLQHCLHIVHSYFSGHLPEREGTLSYFFGSSVSSRVPDIEHVSSRVCLLLSRYPKRVSCYLKAESLWLHGLEGLQRGGIEFKFTLSFASWIF